MTEKKFIDGNLIERLANANNNKNMLNIDLMLDDYNLIFIWKFCHRNLLKVSIFYICVVILRENPLLLLHIPLRNSLDYECYSFYCHTISEVPFQTGNRLNTQVAILVVYNVYSIYMYVSARARVCECMCVCEYVKMFPASNRQSWIKQISNVTWHRSKEPMRKKRTKFERQRVIFEMKWEKMQIYTVKLNVGGWINSILEAYIQPI